LILIQMPLMAFVSAKIATKSQYCKFFP